MPWRPIWCSTIWNTPPPNSSFENRTFVLRRAFVVRQVCFQDAPFTTATSTEGRNMLSSISRSLAAICVMAAVASAQTQSGQAAPQSAAPLPPAPAVGESAPDFTAPAADMNGVLGANVTLSKLKGKVVVLA